MKASILPAGLLFFAAAPSPAAPPADPAGVIRALEGHRLLRGRSARVGAFFYDLTKKRVLFSSRPDEPMAPASNMKILTTAAALEELGPDWGFVTRVYGAGPVRGGRLEGDLLLVAGGDPSWCGKVPGRRVKEVLDSLASALSAKGIRRVTGRLVVDDSFFDREFVHPDWPAGQLQAYYEAPVGALTLEEACLTVRVRGGRPGTRPLVTTFPPGSGFAVVNQAITVRRIRRGGLVVGRRGEWTVAVRGKALAGRSVEFRVAVADPTAFAGKVILAGLRRRGIVLDGGLHLGREGAPPEPERLLWRLETPLVRVVRVVNKDSDNLMAEHLFKTLGRVRGGEGSFAGGRRALLAWLLGMGLSTRGLEIRDGSGLSRRNRLTARVLAAVLTRAWRHSWGRVFSGSLPVGGVDGTLRRRMTRPPLKGRVLAKTGWIRGASALSGYLLCGKREIAFSILVSYPPGVGGFNKHCKAAQERLLEILAAGSRE